MHENNPGPARIATARDRRLYLPAIPVLPVSAFRCMTSGMAILSSPRHSPEVSFDKKAGRGDYIYVTLRLEGDEDCCFWWTQEHPSAFWTRPWCRGWENVSGR